jgi:hypothetical protein
VTIGPVVPARARTADGGGDVTAEAQAEADATAAAQARAQARASARLLLLRQQFDERTQVRAEFEREQTVLRDMMMQQLKEEDAYLKKWIEMI